jgi:SAM-dependent methyltransferase
MGIDYERGARAFRRGRTLPAAILDSWRRAVTGLGLPTGGRVLDLGAGTGQFLGPLAEWLDASVVGVEPSPAMRAEARSAVHAGRIGLVAGRAEALPLRTATIDVAWLSTVVHQIADLDAAVADLRRVVRPGGRVLIRGYFGDRPMTGLFRYFPGVERSAATFPTTVAISEAFARHGFRADTVVDVAEDWSVGVDEWAAKVRQLRHVDSGLRPMTDDEVEAGIAAVEKAFGARPGPAPNVMTISLLVLAA